MIRTIKQTDNAGFEWFDVTDPTTDELREIALKYQLDESSVLDCLQPEHLPKYEMLEDWVFIMLRVFDPYAKHEADTIQELSRKLAIFYSGKTVITIHRSELPVIKELLHAPGNLKKCVSGLLTIFNIVLKCLQSYDAPAQRLLRELDDYEAEVFIRNEIPNVLKSLYHLKRKAAVSNRILNLSTDIIDHMDNHDLPETLVQDLRDLYIRLDTMYAEVQEGVNNLLNIYISLSSQKTNEVVRVLTVFSVFFMPLTFIVGIYGMNFEYMPELRMRFGYPGVILVMGIITASIYFWFKRKRWL